MNITRKEFIIAAAAMLIAGCGNAQDTKEPQTVKETKPMKTLVAYFSATGNTRAEAKLVAKVTQDYPVLHKRRQRRG